jgi:signal transduction histidine kinase
LRPVLVIDDEEVIRDLICSFLRNENIPSICAPDGETGIKLFSLRHPDIVITDIRMPKMDGIEVLKRLKEAKPETEVIVITGHGEIELAIKALQMNASDFLQKPFGLDALKVALKRAQDKIQLRDALAQAQIQLLQSEKLASLGQLSAGVAHEINNPLSFVHSNLGTLKKYLPRILEAWEQIEILINENSSSSPDQIIKKFQELKQDLKLDFILQDMVSIIHQSLDGTQRVKQIVKDLKDYSRLDDKTLEECDLNECVNSTLNIIWNELKYNCEVVKNLATLPRIKCYPQQINQVIMNLLSNASQAIIDKGKISITTAPGDDGGVRLEVSDTGTGIPEEIIDKIFDPFFTTKPVGKGTGLGLNIVYNIINKHGGKIEVKSEVGKGTTFIVQLPPQPPPDAL